MADEERIDIAEGPPGASTQVEGGETVARFASRQEILALDDRQYEVVEVPEWNTMVRVRGLTGTERDAWEASLLQQPAGGRGRPRMNYSDLRAKLIVRCVVGQDDRRVFADADVTAVGAKSASALQRIFEVAQRLSRLTDEDVEELTGNSSSGPNAANGSGSLPTSAAP